MALTIVVFNVLLFGLPFMMTQFNPGQCQGKHCIKPNISTSPVHLVQAIQPVFLAVSILAIVVLFIGGIVDVSLHGVNLSGTRPITMKTGSRKPSTKHEVAGESHTETKEVFDESDKGQFSSEIYCCIKMLNGDDPDRVISRDQRPVLKQLLQAFRSASLQIATDPSNAYLAADPSAVLVLRHPSDPVESFIDEKVFFLQQVLPTSTRSLDGIYQHRPELR